MKRARRRRQIHIRHRGAPNRVGMKRFAREWPEWSAELTAECAAVNKSLAWWLDHPELGFYGLDRTVAPPFDFSSIELPPVRAMFDAAVAAMDIPLYGVSFFFRDEITAIKEPE